MKTPHHQYFDELICTAVRLRIDRFAKYGGPTDEDWTLATSLGDELAERGDQLMLGSPQGDEEAAVLFNRTAHALATLAHGTGGVIFSDMHFEVTKQ